LIPEGFMKKRSRIGRRALSPVITTVLLILVAVILALIIWLWARGLVGEQLTKFSGTEERPIEELCDSTVIRARLSEKKIIVTNEGNVPIYKIGIMISGFGTSKTVYSEELNMISGNTKIVTVTNPEKVSKVYPVLLGKAKNEKLHEYSCRKNAISLETV
jgi:flagellin-like protein